MAGPFAPGDQAVWLEDDPAGMRVWRAEILEVSQEEPDSWRVSTTRGEEVVNREGEGPSLVPMDEEIATDIARKGDGFLVESTVRDLERLLDQSLDWQTLEWDLGQDGPGLGR
jgi:hypothetical protein